MKVPTNRYDIFRYISFVFNKNSTSDNLFNFQCFQDATFLDNIDKLIGEDPTFTFLDPFGYSHTPMSEVKKLIGGSENRRCLLVTLMVEAMNRQFIFQSSAN